MITDPETKKNGGARALIHINAELTKDPDNKDLKEIASILSKNRAKTMQSLRGIIDKTLQDSVVEKLTVKPEAVVEKPLSAVKTK